jgi:monomeric sarcosine oxidase
LVLESYRLWRELEEKVGRPLLVESGLVEVGPADGVVVPGVLRAAAQHGLAVEPMSGDLVTRRWPSLSVDEDLTAVYEPSGGYLLVEDCVRAQLLAAQNAGAEMHAGVTVVSWSADETGVSVETTAGRFTAAHLVVAAGPWAGELLCDLGLNLLVRRKTLMWHASDDRRTHVEAGFPCYLFELPDGVFYGFPQIDERGLKVAEHSGGELVADPLVVDRQLRDDDRRPVEAFLEKHLRAARSPCREFSICLYTMSPDEHFIVDRHPLHERVVFAAGLSGHGFKFAPALGAALAEMAVDGRTTLPIGFLSAAGRFPPRGP